MPHTITERDPPHDHESILIHELICELLPAQPAVFIRVVVRHASLGETSVHARRSDYGSDVYGEPYGTVDHELNFTPQAVSHPLALSVQ